jgi:hypothetical protein
MANQGKPGQVVWGPEDQQASKEATAIRGAFKSSRGKPVHTNPPKEIPRRAA